MAALKEVRITDRNLLKRIEKFRIEAEDNSSTKTAARLLMERMAQIDFKREIANAGRSAESTPSVAG